MYYEIYGQGKPLVLIHGGGSTIQTTFGRVIPLFSKDRQLICVELQAHERTGDQDVATAEHIVAMSKLIPNWRLAIIPCGHGAYIGEITILNPDYKESEFIIPLIENFIDEKTNR